MFLVRVVSECVECYPFPSLTVAPEVDLGWDLRVVGREVYVEEEEDVGVGRVGGADHGCSKKVHPVLERLRSEVVGSGREGRVGRVGGVGGVGNSLDRIS